MHQKGKPLAELLNPDGTFNSTTNYQGSIDLAGFDVQLTANGLQFAPLVGDNDRWESFGGIPGTDGTIWAVVRIGTDLYVGGEFTIAGDVVANRIARWDGTSWSALGTGAVVGA